MRTELRLLTFKTAGYRRIVEVAGNQPAASMGRLTEWVAHLSLKADTIAA